MERATYTMTERVYIYPSDSARWFFVPITKKIGQEIRATYGKSVRGFGAIRVEVMIGSTVWQTSIFPDKYSGSYILPLKAIVRKKEDIEAGEKITYALRVV
jgi:hypothetical protein